MTSMSTDCILQSKYAYGEKLTVIFNIDPKLTSDDISIHY